MIPLSKFVSQIQPSKCHIDVEKNRVKVVPQEDHSSLTDYYMRKKDNSLSSSSSSDPLQQITGKLKDIFSFEKKENSSRVVNSSSWIGLDLVNIPVAENTKYTLHVYGHVWSEQDTFVPFVSISLYNAQYHWTEHIFSHTLDKSCQDLSHTFVVPAWIKEISIRICFPTPQLFIKNLCGLFLELDKCYLVPEEYSVHKTFSGSSSRLSILHRYFDRITMSFDSQYYPHYMHQLKLYRDNGIFVDSECYTHIHSNYAKDSHERKCVHCFLYSDKLKNYLQTLIHVTYDNNKQDVSRLVPSKNKPSVLKGMVFESQVPLVEQPFISARVQHLDFYERFNQIETYQNIHQLVQSIRQAKADNIDSICILSDLSFPHIYLEHKLNDMEVFQLIEADTWNLFVFGSFSSFSNECLKQWGQQKKLSSIIQADDLIVSGEIQIQGLFGIAIHRRMYDTFLSVCEKYGSQKEFMFTQLFSLLKKEWVAKQPLNVYLSTPNWTGVFPTQSKQFPSFHASGLSKELREMVSMEKSNYQQYISLLYSTQLESVHPIVSVVHLLDSITNTDPLTVKKILLSIRSIQLQTIKQWELLLYIQKKKYVMHENLVHILKQIAKADGRIKLISYDAELSFKHIIQQAKGNYITFQGLQEMATGFKLESFTSCLINPSKKEYDKPLVSFGRTIELAKSSTLQQLIDLEIPKNKTNSNHEEGDIDFSCPFVSKELFFNTPSILRAEPVCPSIILAEIVKEYLFLHIENPSQENIISRMEEELAKKSDRIYKFGQCIIEIIPTIISLQLSEMQESSIV